MQEAKAICTEGFRLFPAHNVLLGPPFSVQERTCTVSFVGITLLLFLCLLHAVLCMSAADVGPEA
jgi:hypothetical protein